MQYIGDPNDFFQQCLFLQQVSSLIQKLSVQKISLHICLSSNELHFSLLLITLPKYLKCTFSRKKKQQKIMRTCSSAAGSIASNLNFRIKTRTTRKCSLLQKSAHITTVVMKKKIRIFAQSSPRRFYVLLRNNPNKLLYCNYIAMHILLLILGLAKSALQLLTKNYLIQ